MGYNPGRTEPDPKKRCPECHHTLHDEYEVCLETTDNSAPWTSEPGPCGCRHKSRKKRRK
jgi:hypothetical protein